MFSYSNLERARHIQAFFFDVDGIFTDGGLYFDDHQESTKRFNVLDGFGLKLLRKIGVRTGIITGRNSAIVKYRMENLGVDYIVQGREDKGLALKEACHLFKILPEDCAYMGDDWPDLSAFKIARLAITTPNAHLEVKKRAHLITQKTGGYGAVREACDLVLHAKSVYDDLLQHYI